MIHLQSHRCHQFVVFLPDGGLYNKDRLGLITEALVCQALRMHRQKPGVGNTHIYNDNG